MSGVGVLASFAAGRSKVGPNTVAKLWRFMRFSFWWWLTLQQRNDRDTNVSCDDWQPYLSVTFPDKSMDPWGPCHTGQISIKIMVTTNNMYKVKCMTRHKLHPLTVMFLDAPRFTNWN